MAADAMGGNSALAQRSRGPPGSLLAWSVWGLSCLQQGNAVLESLDAEARELNATCFQTIDREVES